MLFEELIKLTILKWRILRMCVGFECIWISSQVPRVVYYSLIWDQLLIREVSLGLCGYEIYFLKEAHQRADKVKLVNWCFERKKYYFSFPKPVHRTPRPTNPRRERCCSKGWPTPWGHRECNSEKWLCVYGGLNPGLPISGRMLYHWATDTTYSEAVWIAVSISPSALQVSD